LISLIAKEFAFFENLFTLCYPLPWQPFLSCCFVAQFQGYTHLVMLMRNARQVRAQPSHWLPWNFHQHKIKQIA
ncbi:MAG: hypothetical protein AB1489_25100, partial [Acidobacteriota bacterium]